ncbi:MAG: hypothetical protein AAB601_02120 [Patescibacteria group bacterium]
MEVFERIPVLLEFWDVFAIVCVMLATTLRIARVHGKNSRP